VGVSELYEKDIYGWAFTNAQLLRERKYQEIDIENIIEELETMGRGEVRELMHRLTILMAHLLKWQFQPALRSRSCQLTIEEQRRASKKHLKENPSLKNKQSEIEEDAYVIAILDATRETGMDKKTFPKDCPYTFEQLMDDGFYPN
jgi:hypothetical protein